MKGTTASGFCFDIADEVRDDMELLEGMIKLDNGDTSVLFTVLESLLGAEGKKALYEHCRKENGRVSAVRIFEELSSIMDAIQAGEETDVKN